MPTPEFDTEWHSVRVEIQREAVRQSERTLAQARQSLTMQLQIAKKAGATIAQLMEWSGYSRRQVFNLLRKP